MSTGLDCSVLVRTLLDWADSLTNAQGVRSVQCAVSWQVRDCDSCTSHLWRSAGRHEVRLCVCCAVTRPRSDLCAFRHSDADLLKLMDGASSTAAAAMANSPPIDD